MEKFVFSTFAALKPAALFKIKLDSYFSRIFAYFLDLAWSLALACFY